MFSTIGLMTILIFETLGFLLFKPSSKKKQRIELLVRVLILAVIVVSFTVGILDLTVKYYLFILVTYLYYLYRIYVLTKTHNTQINTLHPSKRSLFLWMITLMVISAVPLVLFPESNPISPSGEYDVLEMDFHIVDSSRTDGFQSEVLYRQISIHAWYPAHVQASYPLIVYSHGGISLNTSNESLFLELASHGYVVFSINHLSHSIISKNLDGKNVWIDADYLNELNAENAKETPENSLVLYQKWMDVRTKDMNFVLDSVIHQYEGIPSSLFDIIDVSNIGLIGHSLGGSAALCMGRMRSDIDAIIALESPYMCDLVGIEDHQFVLDETPYPTNVMNLYTDSTWNQLENLPQYAQNVRLLSMVSDQITNQYLPGTGHFSITDLAISSPILTRFFNGFKTEMTAEETLIQINHICLNYLDSKLK